MTDESINEVNQEAAVDPVIKFLATLRFDTDVFTVLHQASMDPEQYDKFFQSPELFVLLNASHVLNDNDPNKGEIDHQAIQNLLRWITVKCATDPVWMCYFGWLFRFIAVHTDPSSYWPIKFSPRFLPKNFIKRGESFDIGVENRKIKTPEEVFKKSKQ
jgi:hypothetical protein